MNTVEIAQAIEHLAKALAAAGVPSAVARDMIDTITLLLAALRAEAGVFK